MEQSVTRLTQRGLPAVAENDLATDVKRLLEDGRREEAAKRFGEIIDRQQRRAARIAYHYLRDQTEVDEVVQDAFLKAFLNLSSFREELFFQLWFTRILINACLDRLKAKTRRARWMTPSALGGTQAENQACPQPSPEARLLANERRALLEVAIDRLPIRQRTAVILCHLDGRPTREASIIMGLKESTIRVHLFRAIRKLRSSFARRDWSSGVHSETGRVSRRGA
jgi:RNA polymerase sigma-70 factor (ECF subfamily)